MAKKRKKTRGPGWTVILVPPRPGAPTRQVSVSTRSLISVGTVALMIVAGAATYTGETTKYANNAADRLAESQRTVVGLLDSVQILQAMAARAAKLPPKDMIMPVAQAYISSSYKSSRLHPILDIFRSHKGVDLAANRGTPIVAPAAGRVRSVGWRMGYGITVELEHTGGVVTLFAHCDKALVKVGDRVTAGDVIARVGSTGLATGPHVHFEVHRNGQSVDPIRFLAETRDSVANMRAIRGEVPSPRPTSAVGTGGTDGRSLDSLHR
jgi:murein DD-endopeptidase MepM/ murein hydrolase activator NlpD